MVWAKPSLWADQNATNDIGTNRSVVGSHRKKSTLEPTPRANLKRPTYHNKDSKVLVQLGNHGPGRHRVPRSCERSHRRE